MSLFSLEDLNYVRSRYESRIARDGLTFQSMNSGTQEKQKIRHSVHGEVISANSSVLDVGCGLGQFHENLAAFNYSGQYLGIDIVPEYIQYCNTTFPKAQFKLINLFEKGFPGNFDVITSSQVFNSKYPKAHNEVVIQTFIKDAFSHANSCVSIDMLTSYVDFEIPEMHYFSPEKLFRFAKSITPFVKLRHDYLPFEFTCQLFCKDPIPKKVCQENI